MPGPARAHRRRPAKPALQKAQQWPLHRPGAVLTATTFGILLRKFSPPANRPPAFVQFPKRAASTSLASRLIALLKPLAWRGGALRIIEAPGARLAIRVWPRRLNYNDAFPNSGSQ